jgi:8-oxo-dGTP diphosphatase
VETDRSGKYLVSSAAHLLLFRGSDLLVIRRANPEYLNGFWSLPAGHVEPGETAVDACVRETKEEIGLELTPGQLEFILVQQKGDCDGEARIDFFFESHLPSYRQLRLAVDPAEVAELRWMTIDRLPEPFAPYVVTALQARARSQRLSFWGLG